MLRRPLAGLAAAALGRAPSDGMSEPRPVVLSGPSGAGKSTLLKRLLQEHGSIFGFSVSREVLGVWGALVTPPGAPHLYIHRDVPMLLNPPTPPQAELGSSGTPWGWDVWALDGPDGSQWALDGSQVLVLRHHEGPKAWRREWQREVMQRDIAAGDFIEHAEFSGNLYGTSKAAVRVVQAMNRICVLDVDLQGVRNIKKTDLKPIYIFVQPPSLEVLEQRLRQRNTETEESLAKRLAAAQADMESSKEPGLFDLIIVNDSLDKAYWALKEALSEEIKKAQGTGCS